MLVVEDDGIGFDLERHSEKNGLGTLVVEQLCMQFGEKPVYCRSESGAGTRVVVRLSSLVDCSGNASGK